MSMVNIFNTEMAAEYLLVANLLSLSWTKVDFMGRGRCHCIYCRCRFIAQMLSANGWCCNAKEKV